MAELKTQPTRASVTRHIAAIEDPQRRTDAKAVLKLMREVTGAKPTMWGSSIIGFGKYRYRYESGRSGEWPVVGFSPRKRELVLYIVPGFAESSGLLESLGKHRTGKSCLYIKRLSDVNLEVLRALVEGSLAVMAERYPDAEGTGTRRKQKTARKKKTPARARR